MAKERIIITVTNNLVSDNRVAKLAAYFELKGFEVLLVGRKWPGGKIPTGRAGRVIRFNLLFNKGPLFYLSINIRILLFLLIKKVNWIVSVDLDTLPACIIAGKIKRVPVVMDSHEYFPEIPELQHRPFVKKTWLWLEGKFIRHIHAGITVSPGLVEIYKDKYNLNFHLVRNVPLKKKVVQEINIKVTNPVVYYQGALNLGRGLESSIRAMEFLPGYRFVIVGDGDISNELRALSTELNLNDRITFVGKVPFEALQSYIRNADVGLCLLENIGLNYYHSLPNRIFDYPMAGLPILATSFPDISQIVTEYETGLLIKGLEPKYVADAIKEACENIELRKRWSVTLPKAVECLNWTSESLVLDKIFWKEELISS